MANSQQRPLLFWLVRGLVLKSIKLLKTWASAILAARDNNEWLISAPLNTLCHIFNDAVPIEHTETYVRASWARGSAETSCSQDAILSRVSAPLADSGEQVAMVEEDTRGFSCSSTRGRAALDGVAPMMVDVVERERERCACMHATITV